MLNGDYAERPDDPSEEGWVFEGWFLDEDCTEEFDFSTRIFDDTTLFAKWSQFVENPDTDDNSSIFVWSAILFISAAVLLRKKEEQ